MNTHVLIVDTKTLKLHLEYAFFGTGAKETKVDFNNRPTTQHHYAAENNLVSMIADGMRVRKGDNIIFYLQQNASDGVSEGKFYGVFQAVADGIFLDDYDPQQYLLYDLDKSLTFRGLIEPLEVYPEGVTEWEALDEIKNIKAPFQMLWSLIYRKLKGNRGNTMITIYEAERLIHLIRLKNGQHTISNSYKLSYDVSSQTIIDTGSPHLTYQGRKDSIDIVPRLIKKYKENKAHEAHLQAYITQNVYRNTNPSLDNAIFGQFQGYTLNWIGNEVACGVGMQRIDVALEIESSETNSRRIMLPIELKAVPVQADIVRQVNRYVMWLNQYYLPNRICMINPIIIGQAQSHISTAYSLLINSLKAFSKAHASEMSPVDYIEYDIHGSTISFTKVAY